MLSKKKHTWAAKVLRGQSPTVLLTGVALNWFGAAKLAREVWRTGRSSPVPSDYAQMKAFTAGTAATFGALYLYLYAKQEPARPLLVFGASLKTWAFVLSAILRAEHRLDRGSFLTFGVSNGLVGALFWAHIAQDGRPEPR